jgi:hypothetical protein
MTLSYISHSELNWQLSNKLYQALNGSMKIEYDVVLANETRSLVPVPPNHQSIPASNSTQNNQFTRSSHNHIQNHILKTGYLQ